MAYFNISNFLTRDVVAFLGLWSVSAVVEHSTRNPEVGGSHPASVTESERRKKMHYFDTIKKVVPITKMH